VPIKLSMKKPKKTLFRSIRIRASPTPHGKWHWNEGFCRPLSGFHSSRRTGILPVHYRYNNLHPLESWSGYSFKSACHDILLPIIIEFVMLVPLVGDRPCWMGSCSAKPKVWKTCIILQTTSEGSHHHPILQVSHMSFGPCWTSFPLNVHVSSFSLILMHETKHQ
jgi:hypothetical protein